MHIRGLGWGVGVGVGNFSGSNELLRQVPQGVEGKRQVTPYSLHRKI